MNNSFNKVYMFNSSNKTLDSLQNMKQTSLHFGITYHKMGKNVYILGGVVNIYEPNQRSRNHCEKYSVEKDEWTVISPMITNMSNVSACIFDDKYIFVISAFGNP